MLLLLGETAVFSYLPPSIICQASSFPVPGTKLRPDGFKTLPAIPATNIVALHVQHQKSCMVVASFILAYRSSEKIHIANLREGGREG